MINYEKYLNEEDSRVTREAKNLKLKYAGYGYYKNAQGTTTHVNKDGKLKLLSQIEQKRANRHLNLHKEEGNGLTVSWHHIISSIEEYIDEEIENSKREDSDKSKMEVAKLLKKKIDYYMINIYDI